MAHLHYKGYAASIITSYNSALGYSHKLHNFSDPTSSFFISKLLQGIRKKNPSSDARMPITIAVLQKLVSALNNLQLSEYKTIMFKAMFLTAFYGFLRNGEITVFNLETTENRCLDAGNIERFDAGFLISFKS